MVTIMPKNEVGFQWKFSKAKFLELQKLITTQTDNHEYNFDKEYKIFLGVLYRWIENKRRRRL